jgi:capsular polysaccharide biosynthesis protein
MRPAMTDMIIAAVEVPRWDPQILLSERVNPTGQVEQFGYRAPSRFTAPEIRFSEPQPLFVAGDKFTILAERSGLVPGSTYLYDEYQWRDLFASSRTILPTREVPTLASGNAAWINYSHWLFQCLAPILVAPEAGLNDFDALMPPLNSAQRDFLALAEIDPSRIIELPAGTAAVPQLGIFSNLTSGDFPFVPHPSIVAAFERLAPLAPPSAFAGQRVFLSRADTRNRAMINETELRSHLEGENYAIVVPGTLSVLEQIALFRDAAVIVGQHGAALTNLLFAPRGADGPIVVELHQENYPALGFAKISQVKRLRYTAIFGRMVDPGADGRHDSTWEADIPLVRKTLAEL